MPEDDWWHKIHLRLIAADPIAPAELINAVLPSLQKTLGQRNPRFRNSHLLYDAIIDTLMGFVKRPGAYDPSKLPLLNFLLMSAQRDFQNALSKEKRRREREILVENVEFGEELRNETIEPGDFDVGTYARELIRKVRVRLKDPRDLKVLDLMIAGERSTKTFSKILGIENLPLSEQRREVKRCKDRIRKRLERYGKESFGPVE